MTSRSPFALAFTFRRINVSAFVGIRSTKDCFGVIGVVTRTFFRLKSPVAAGNLANSSNFRLMHPGRRFPRDHLALLRVRRAVLFRTSVVHFGVY